MNNKKRNQELPLPHPLLLTLSLLLTFAPYFNNSSTTDWCPYQEARWRGVKENYGKQEEITRLHKIEKKPSNAILMMSFYEIYLESAIGLIFKGLV